MHRVVLSALLALAAAPCVATAQAEPAATSRARERAQRLQRAVDEMVALVEKHAELKFKEPPRVRAANHKQWRAIVKREFELEKGRDIFEVSLSTQGLYLPETKEVVLSPLVVAPLLVELDDALGNVARWLPATTRPSASPATISVPERGSVSMTTWTACLPGSAGADRLP